MYAGLPYISHTITLQGISCEIIDLVVEHHSKKKSFTLDEKQFPFYLHNFSIFFHLFLSASIKIVFFFLLFLRVLPRLGQKNTKKLVVFFYTASMTSQSFLARPNNKILRVTSVVFRRLYTNTGFSNESPVLGLQNIIFLSRKYAILCTWQN